MPFRNFLVVTALCLPTAVLAEMPVFSAQCLSNYVDADSTGTAAFIVPERAYNFRADEGGDQVYSGAVDIVAGEVNAVEINLD